MDDTKAKGSDAGGAAAPGEWVGRLWQALVQGQAEITAASVAGDVLLMRMLTVPRPALEPRTARVLERLLLGGSQKECAHEFGISTSTTAQIAKQGLHALGLSCLPSRAPVLLAVLVCLSGTRGGGSPLLVNEFELAGVRHVEVVFRSAAALLAGTLSQAECAVADLVLAGKPYVEIAEHRRTSVRTVANQIAAAFHRLRVSGRAELVAKVARSACAAI